MQKRILEACVDSVESAIAAERGGATRLELCSNLVIGGTTPELSLYESVRENTNIEINVLIRPRFGDFLYTDFEYDMMLKDVERFREAGADGIVVGCLLPDGSMDMERMKRLRDTAGTMNMTLHRAFDVCKDPFATLEQAKELGINTILTSGQQNTCYEGRGLIKQLLELAKDDIAILIGGGVNAEVISKMCQEMNAKCFHMSGKTILQSEMLYRKEGVNMGLPGLGEYEIWRTSESEIAKAKQALWNR